MVNESVSSPSTVSLAFRIFVFRNTNFCPLLCVTMYVVPEKELYTLVQLFYAGHHTQVATMDLDAELDFTNALYRLEAVMYQARSRALVGDKKGALAAVEGALSDLKEASAAGLVDAQSGAYVQAEFEALASYIQGASVDVAMDDTLGSMYKYLQGGELPAAGENLELLVFSSLVSGNGGAIEGAKASLSEALILDFACAWLGMKVDEEEVSAKGAYYFFDELCSSTNTATDKTWVSLAVCHLKMGHVEEAQDCLARLQGETESSLVARIAIAAQTGDNATREELTKELQAKYPNCGYVADLSEKQTLFDEVVAAF